MRKNNGNKPPRKCASEEQKRAIRRSYAIRKAKENAGQTPAVNNRSNDRSKKAAPQSAVGKIYRGETKYIDREPKKQRNYVVVRDSPRGVSVAKLKSIKQFDENGKNADKALVEINHERYGLPNRTGVDSQVFSQNQMSKQPLRVQDKCVFPEQKERATLGSSDLHNVLRHTGKIKKTKKKK